VLVLCCELEGKEIQELIDGTELSGRNYEKRNDNKRKVVTKERIWSISIEVCVSMKKRVV